MSTIASFKKDPNAVLDYAMSWSLWMASGETVSSASWAIDGAPDASLAIDSSSIVSGVPTVWLSGGTAGQSYRVRCRVTTSASRIDDRSISIRVTER